jgi:glycosyltransferase involved in cell wall biosynthesis
MPLRVVIVAPWGERLGGAEEMLWLALAHRDRRRLAPTVAFLGPGPFVEETAGLGIATAVIPAGRLRDPRAALGTVRRLAALLRRERPDLLLGWSAKTHLYGAPAAALAGLRGRVVWWQHEIPKRHWMDRLATRLPALAIGCSSEASRAAQRRLRPRRPAFVVNPGIEVGASANGAREGLRERLGIPAGRSIVGIVGRLQPWKGQDRFLAALAELRGRGHDLHGLVVGGDAYGLSPRYTAELERLVPRLGLSEHVTMTGQVADPRPYYGLMDVAVNASVGEPFGIVLLEAMDAGVPVVAVAEGGPLDIVEPGVTGTLVECGEPAELAEGIAALLADSGRRAAMSAAARRSCRERFAAAEMSERLTERLTELARG